jgi:hypothetical protein
LSRFLPLTNSGMQIAISGRQGFTARYMLYSGKVYARMYLSS